MEQARKDENVVEAHAQLISDGRVPSVKGRYLLANTQSNSFEQK